MNLIVLRVANLDRSRRFYETLGIQFVRERHGTGPEHFAATVGGVVFELYPAAEGACTERLRLGFRLACVDTAVAAVRELGIEVVSRSADGPWGRRAVVADPDGNRVELTGLTSEG